MLTVMIPAGGSLNLAHLVCDLNGTLATDGELLEGVVGRLTQLSTHVQVHVLTADTHGTAERTAEILRVACIAADVPAPRWVRVGAAAEKASYVATLGADTVVAIGNGANDELMLREAALSMCVLGEEGVYVPALLAADLLVRTPLDGLDLLLSPDRLIATLRP
jgi:soluble P-type ATPase